MGVHFCPVPFSVSQQDGLFRKVLCHCCHVSECSACFRVEGDAYTQYKAMIVATGLQLLLLMFELLACDKLGSNPHKMLWILVCIPLFCVSVASIGLCVWALKHGRTFEVSTLLLSVTRYASLSKSQLEIVTFQVSTDCMLHLWSPYVIGQTIYIFILFLLLLSFFFLA